MSRFGEVYVIECPDGRYVGSCLGWSTGRWSEHLRSLRAGTHSNAALQASFDEAGVRAMTFRVLEDAVPESLLREKERSHVNACKNALNVKTPYQRRADLYEKIISDVADGETYIVIADRHGCSHGLVGRVVTQHGGLELIRGSGRDVA